MPASAGQETTGRVSGAPLPGQLPLPLDQWDRQYAMWPIMDARTQPTTHRRMGKCGKVRMVIADSIEVERFESGTYRYNGLVRCDTWQCPTCGPAKARQRAGLLGVAIAKHREPSTLHDTWLLTFTFWHQPHETQAEKVARLFAAWETFNKDRRWRRFCRRFGVIGVVRCFDETFGTKGLHPHFHVLLFVERGVDAATGWTLREPPPPELHAVINAFTGADERPENSMRKIARLRAARRAESAAWRASSASSSGAEPSSGQVAPCQNPFAEWEANARRARLRAIGREQILPAWEDAVRATGVFPRSPDAFRAQAVDLRGGEHAATYVVKWGLGDEAIRSPDKHDSHTELLNAAAKGDGYKGELFREWADATRGRNFCTGTTRLREKLAITDEEIVAWLDEHRRRREAEDARNGIEPPPKRAPLRVSLSTLLLPSIVRLGWGKVFREIEAAEERGDDVQLAIERFLWREGAEASASSTRPIGRAPPAVASSA